MPAFLSLLALLSLLLLYMFIVHLLLACTHCTSGADAPYDFQWYGAPLGPQTQLVPLVPWSCFKHAEPIDGAHAPVQMTAML